MTHNHSNYGMILAYFEVCVFWEIFSKPMQPQSPPLRQHSSDETQRSSRGFASKWQKPSTPPHQSHIWSGGWRPDKLREFSRKISVFIFIRDIWAVCFLESKKFSVLENSDSYPAVAWIQNGSAISEILFFMKNTNLSSRYEGYW